LKHHLRLRQSRFIVVLIVEPDTAAPYHEPVIGILTEVATTEVFDSFRLCNLELRLKVTTDLKVICFVINCPDTSFPNIRGVDHVNQELRCYISSEQCAANEQTSFVKS
jgi:hypothetical protein